MHSQTISKETLSNLKDWRADCRCMKKAFLAESSKETNPLTKTLYKSLAASFVNVEMISSWIELSLVSINNLSKKVDNMSSKQEFNAVRKGLLSSKPSKKQAQRNQRSSKTHDR